jgi:hypothetical protein
VSWIWLLGICYRIDFVYTAFFVYSISHPAFLLRLGYFYTSHLIAIKPFINPGWGSFSSQSISTETETENRKPKTENRKPKTENRKPKTENRKPKTENRKPKTENRKSDAASTCMLQS